MKDTHWIKFHWRAVLSLVAVLAAGLALTRSQHTFAQSPRSVSDAGTIAYIRDDGLEIRLVEPDGSNDRSLWLAPAGTVYGISSVAWRPDGALLAFTSGHEATCSQWHADVYVIYPNGTGLRRVTNNPKCADLSSYPRGTVIFEVENQLVGVSDFIFYIQGALSGYGPVHVAPGTVVALTWTNYVADLGAGVHQSPVAINATHRWLSPAIYADVVPGTTVNAGRLIISSGNQGDAWGASNVTWSPDGTQIGFKLGQGSLWKTGLSTTPVLNQGSPLLDPSVSVAASKLAWSPTGNEVLYEQFAVAQPGINRATVGGASAGTRIVDTTLTAGISWLPDGSGFIYTDHSALLGESNIYRYDFGSGMVTPLTDYSGEFATTVSTSPDGGSFVFSHSVAGSSSLDLQIMSIDGSSVSPLASHAGAPNWSRVQPRAPFDLFLPLVRR